MTAAADDVIQFTCSFCRSVLTVPIHLAGVSGPCPHCRNTITSPPGPTRPEQFLSAAPPPTTNIPPAPARSSVLPPVMVAPPTPPAAIPSAPEPVAVAPAPGPPLPWSLPPQMPAPAAPPVSESALPQLSPASVLGPGPAPWASNGHSQLGGASAPHPVLDSLLGQPGSFPLPQNAAPSPTSAPFPQPHLPTSPAALPTLDPKVQRRAVRTQAPKKKSGALMIALLMLLLAAGGAAWFFQDQTKMLIQRAMQYIKKEKVEEPAAQESPAPSLPKPAHPPNSSFNPNAPPEKKTVVTPESTSTTSAPGVSSAPTSFPKPDASLPVPPAPSSAPVNVPGPERSLPSIASSLPAPTPPARESVTPPAPETYAKAIPVHLGETDSGPSGIVEVPHSINSNDKAKGAHPDDRLFVNVPTEAQPAVDALKKFFAASTWQERLPYSQVAHKMKSLMERYYEGKPDGPIRVSRIELLRQDSSPEVGTPQCVFQVSGPSLEEPLPVMVESSPDGWKVDWLTFTEFKDKLLLHYLEKWQDNPGRFHVMMRRTHYFDDDVPEKEKKYCIEVAPPMPGFSGFVFVTKGTPLAKELDRVVGWQVNNAAAIVELQWIRQDHYQWVEITTIPQYNWHTPGADGAADRHPAKLNDDGAAPAAAPVPPMPSKAPAAPPAKKAK